MTRRIDITGKRFGTLVAVRPTNVRSNGNMQWECLCDCGKTHIADIQHLKNGKIKNCGCKPSNTKDFGTSSFNRVLKAYKTNARKRNLEFSLTEEEFRNITSNNCYYCGVTPSMSTYADKSNGYYIYNGVDRVDNSMGYVSGNCVPCCSNCNRAKMALSYDDFIDLIRRIYAIHVAAKSF